MWNEIIIKTPAKYCDDICNLINTMDYDGMYIEDYSDMMDNILVKRTNLVEQELIDKIGNDSVIHTYLDEKFNPQEHSIYLESKLYEMQVPYSITVKPIEEKNWIDEWKKYFNIFKIEPNIVVVPSWKDYTVKDNEVMIKIDPGAAFGTGTHETTKMCVEALQQYAPTINTVLDVGTGSGILAIASLLCGAKSALGIDIDPLSVKTANENALINGVSDSFKAIEGNLTDAVTEKYDLITANIVADVIVILLKDIRKFMNEGCHVILSGIISDRLKLVEDAIKEYNFTVVEHKQLKEWHCITVK